jgi:hypothetical protein
MLLAPIIDRIALSMRVSVLRLIALQLILIFNLVFLALYIALRLTRLRVCQNRKKHKNGDAMQAMQATQGPMLLVVSNETPYQT